MFHDSAALLLHIFVDSHIPTAHYSFDNMRSTQWLTFSAYRAADHITVSIGDYLFRLFAAAAFGMDNAELLEHALSQTAPFLSYCKSRQDLADNVAAHDLVEIRFFNAVETGQGQISYRNDRSLSLRMWATSK